MKLAVAPSSRPLAGRLSLPGDKSISHRAVILGALADGVTEVQNLLEGEDVLSTIGIFRDLGVKIVRTGPGRWRVYGVGLHGLKASRRLLDCGNSGTTLRLLTGLLAAFPFESRLTGDASLGSRPMGRVIQPLQKMGAAIHEVHRRGRRIVVVRGGRLTGGHFRIPVASAQLKSALLLAGLAAGKQVSVTEPFRSRDHSERMLRSFGAPLKTSGLTSTLGPTRRLRPQKIVVPADFSSAAFFLVAALIHPHPSRAGSTGLTLQGVGLNPTRTGALKVLKKMGGRITVSHRRTVCGEPVGDLTVLPSELQETMIGGELIPRLIDEIPILAVAAAVAHGTTLIRNAGELRIKETDRIRAIAAEFTKFGIAVKELPDGLVIEGIGTHRHLPLHGATVKSYGDHRMAMSLAVLGTVAPPRSLVQDTGCITTSFPSFVPLFRRGGANLKTI